MTYSAPIKDIRFALEACGDFWTLREAFPDIDPDLIGAILEGAGQIAAETLAPLNRPGDLAGIALENGVVRAAPGFAEAYRAYAAGGWTSLGADPAYGGQGLPQSLALAAAEMTYSANMSFSLCPMLTTTASEAIHAHASAELRAAYLPKLISGEWSGAMNLTEPQAGSDLGILTTKAQPALDGSYRITGQKIFITWGEHDMAENIVHLVLARLPDAPAGAKGISLFLAPKILPDGTHNALRCIGVEEKMGLHASPTCTMAYEGATAWLVGEENRGLAAMFTMMNAARLNVGTQGVGIAEAATQKARAYARERKQGGALIAAHPDVRRMLLTMKAKTHAARALCYATAIAADRGDKAREDLFTPLAKSWSTDVGVEVASLGVQIHGGMGFVEEGGAAQFLRDARIAPIYEGTNGIQAMDLVGRKLQGDGGAAMGALIAEARAVAALARDSERSAAGQIAQRLAIAAEALEGATRYMLTRSERRDALAGANPYLDLAAETAAGMLLLRGVMNAPDEAQEKLALFFAETILAAAPARTPLIEIGAAKLDEAVFEDWAY
ncbi:MAG: acyl-CoA dehydrogenase [Hyphomonadaceae bacterium]